MRHGLSLHHTCLQAALLLFEMSTLEGWPDVMFVGIDATEPSLRPRVSMVKVPSLAVPSSPLVPPQGAPGGSEQLGTPRARPRPLGAQAPPPVLERAASKVAHFTACL